MTPIAFMGSDAVALPLLDYLQEAQPAGFSLSLVFTQPDRPSGRGMHVHVSPVKEWAQRHGIEVVQPQKCGAAEAELLRSRGIGLVLVMAYGQILPRALLDAAPLGVLNLHASALPRLRGASPIQTAVALGLPDTAVSLMRIVPQLDAGPVADAETVPIRPADTTACVHQRLASACVPLLARALPRLATGKLAFTGQDPARVTYCRIIEKSDCHLDFTCVAAALAARVRAFQPWPGSSFPHGGHEIRVLSAEPVQGEGGGAPGTVTLDHAGFPVVACGADALRLLSLQRPGGKPLPADAFLRGYPLAAGTVLESRAMRALEAPRPFPRPARGNSTAPAT